MTDTMRYNRALVTHLKRRRRFLGTVRRCEVMRAPYTVRAGLYAR